jgi:hypothetical protein
VQAQEEAEYALLKQGIVVEDAGTDVHAPDVVAALQARMAAYIEASTREKRGAETEAAAMERGALHSRGGGRGIDGPCHVRCM